MSISLFATVRKSSSKDTMKPKKTTEYTDCNDSSIFFSSYIKKFRLWKSLLCFSGFQTVFVFICEQKVDCLILIIYSSTGGFQACISKDGYTIPWSPMSAICRNPEQMQAAIGTLDGIIDTFYPIPSLAIACSIEVSWKDSYGGCTRQDARATCFSFAHG
ncbi:hypothetical protein FRX31_021257 [Thalictrum thalictroides]|uniref:Uncharacterized protein n=1 Tax=Thalictrum thalictroides TaxID=46969 RepID=A0A7J6VVM5_THATH|nr:hypothetical protein FRX31_021257 [Thalictrum thalictroides]